MRINFIKYSKIWLAFSTVVTVASIIVLSTWGLKLGIDFTGGSLMEIEFSNNLPDDLEIRKVLDAVDVSNATIQKTGEYGVLIRTVLLSEDDHQKTLKAISDNFEKDSNTVLEKRFEMIGPSISKQLRERSVTAIILVFLGIILYIAYAFRHVSKPVASWKYGLLAIVALLHDVLLVMGVFAILGHFTGVEVNTAFVVAVLTVLGYSVNDTIVVYDRIRERLLSRKKENFSDLVDNGLNQTLMRSINTTLTTLLPLFALFLFGGTTIHNFALALLIGMASGAYSSIFIASPLLVYVEKWQNRKK